MIDETILATIDKLSWIRQSLLWKIGKQHNLSSLQVQIMDYLNKHSENHSNITQISKIFFIAKSTVSEAVKTLEKKKLVIKTYSKENKKLAIIVFTPEGKEIVKKLSAWNKDFTTHLKKFNIKTKKTISLFLLEFILSLKNAGIIDTAKACIACENFSYNFNKNEDSHFCKLLNKIVDTSDIKLDCEEFLEKKSLNKSLRFINTQDINN